MLFLVTVRIFNVNTNRARLTRIMRVYVNYFVLIKRCLVLEFLFEIIERPR